jgi:MFS family permease
MVIYNIYAICAFAALGKYQSEDIKPPLTSPGGMLFGFDISSMSGVFGMQGFKQYFHDPGDVLRGFITASMPFGSFFGSISSSFIADRFSRRTALQIGGLIFMFGAALQCSAQNVPHLMVGRVISGVSIGICSAVVPVYQSEIAPKAIRGRVVSLQQWAITWFV